MIQPAKTIETSGAEHVARLVELRLEKGLHTVVVEQLFSPQNMKYWQNNNGIGAGPRLTRQLNLAEFPWSANEVEREINTIFATLNLPVEIDQQRQYMRVHVSPKLFAVHKMAIESVYATASNAGIVTRPNER